MARTCGGLAWRESHHSLRGGGVRTGEHELGVVFGRVVGLAFVVVGFEQAASLQESFDASVELVGEALDVLVLGWRDICEREIGRGGPAHEDPVYGEDV